jgi:hypothetical protein
MTASPFNYQVPADVQARLLDRELVRAAYAEHSIKLAGKTLGCGQKTMEKALRYHGIKVRKRGERPPGMMGMLTRDELRSIVYRAYRRNDRCPVDCIGRATCLDADGRCVLGEVAG